MLKLLLYITIVLALTACLSKNDDHLHVNSIDEDGSYIYFELFNKKNEYWAHFIIHEVDKTAAYTDNSGIKFRTDIAYLRYVKYQKNDDSSESGKLYLRWKHESEDEKFYVTDMEIKDWERIKSFTSDWAERDKFIP